MLATIRHELWTKLGSLVEQSRAGAPADTPYRVFLGDVLYLADSGVSVR